MRRKLSAAIALASLAALLTAAPGRGQGYYPVVIDVKTKALGGGELCIETIVRANPGRVVIEKGPHKDWFEAKQNATAPAVKWLLAKDIPGYTWTTKKKITPPSDRDFFAGGALGSHDASRKKADDTAPAITGRERWHYEISADFANTQAGEQLKEKCAQANIPAPKTLDPQIVFNGGAGAEILPRWVWIAFGALVVMVALLWFRGRPRDFA